MPWGRKMGVGLFAGRQFRIDPHSVSWDFKAKTSVTNTLGGKVIQVFGTKLSTMKVDGVFGTGGWKAQLLFLQEIKEISAEQVRAGRISNSDIQPFIFMYPPRDWMFQVWLKNYTSPDGDAVVHSNEIINPKWTLELFIVEDNSGLKQVAQNAYIARIGEGLGWRQTLFNGPLGDLNTTLNPNQPTQPSTGVRERGFGSVDSGGNAVQGANFPPEVERWRGLVARYFPASVVNQALSVMWCESRGNPKAVNPSSGAAGLFQHLPKYWAQRSAAVGFGGKSAFDPEANVAAAAALYKSRGNWSHWSCKPAPGV